MTFEAYQKYSDYQKGNMKWGSPSDLKEDAILLLRRIVDMDKFDTELKDVSVDNKGIKFELRIGKDLIHLFKVGPMRGGWEIYLNKKKSNGDEVRRYLDDTYSTPFDKFMKYAMSYDFNADRIDDRKRYKNAKANNEAIEKLFDNLNSSEKRKAIKKLIQMGMKESELNKVFQA